MAEGHVFQVLIDAPAERRENAAHGVELARRRALEREDGLLLVADREDGSLDRAGAGTGEEFGGQQPDDLPLLRAGVLRLVDQHVVDALVELVVHPGRPVLAEQVQRLVDQVVVVEQPAPVLRPLVAGDHGIGDGDERRGAVAAGDRLATLPQRYQARLFLSQALGERGCLLASALRHDVGARLEFGVEEHLEVGLDSVGAGRPPMRR